MLHGNNYQSPQFRKPAAVIQQEPKRKTRSSVEYLNARSIPKTLTFATHHTFADTAPLAPTPALGTQSVELVEENDARRGRPRPLENLADGLLRLPDVLVQKLGAYFRFRLRKRSVG